MRRWASSHRGTKPVRLPEFHTDNTKHSIPSGIPEEHMQSLADFMQEQGDRAKGWRDKKINLSDFGDDDLLPHEWRYEENKRDNNRKFRFASTPMDKQLTEAITTRLEQETGTDIPVIHGRLSDLKMKAAMDKIKTMGSEATYWVVDALDSTQGFIDPKESAYCTKLALIKGGKPVEGIIYYPEIKTLFYTKGGQAWVRRGESEARAVHVPEVEQSLGSAEVPIRITHRLLRHDGIREDPLHLMLNKLKHAGIKYKHDTMRFLDEGRTIEDNGNIYEHDPIIAGSQNKFPEELAIVEGKAHLGVRNSEYEWDRAPNEAFIRAAGGQSAYIRDDRPHEYGSKEDFWINSNMLVTTPDVLGAMKRRPDHQAAQGHDIEQPWIR